MRSKGHFFYCPPEGRAWCGRWEGFEVNERHVLRVFAKYTLMSVGGMLANSCYILADTFLWRRGLAHRALPR